MLQPRTVLVTGLVLQAALAVGLVIAHAEDPYLFVLAVLVQLVFAVVTLAWSLVSSWIGRLRGRARLLAFALPATAGSVTGVAVAVVGSMHWGC